MNECQQWNIYYKKKNLYLWKTLDEILFDVELSYEPQS